MKRFAMPFLIAFIVLVTVVPSWLGVYNGYIQYIIVLAGINISLAVSLNLINGYMGEFSVGHAAFMGVGAYITSILTLLFIGGSKNFGDALLGPGWSLIVFPLSLIVGAIAAALFSLLVAIPSFRTRGDYLAIITLAVNFIFKSVVENIDSIGGPRGLMGMGNVISTMEEVIDLPWIMIWTLVVALLTIYIIRNFITSTLGKGVVAIREDEIAAELMTVNTRRLKVIAFMLGCGLAGAAGGLHGQLVGYINPSQYFILQSTMMLVMVYMGGMGSISGSVVGAIGLTVALEALRGLDVYRWVAIPLLLIFLMLFRPTGIMGNKELHQLFPWLRKYVTPAEERIELVSTSD